MVLSKCLTLLIFTLKLLPLFQVDSNVQNYYTHDKKWLAIVPQFVPINNSSFTLRWIFLIKISGMSPPFIKAFTIQPEPSTLTSFAILLLHATLVLVKFHQLFGFSPQNFYSYPSPHLEWLFPESRKFQICHPSNCYLSFTFCMKCISTLWK